MPQMADVIVKKADETTNTTYSQVVPSAGDKSPAVWKNNSVGSAPAHKPTVRCTSRTNGTNTARRVDLTLLYPQLATDSSGTVSVVNTLKVDVVAYVPQGMPQTDIDEGVAQACNFIASTLIKSVLKSGYSPT